MRPLNTLLAFVFCQILLSGNSLPQDKPAPSSAEQTSPRAGHPTSFLKARSLHYPGETYLTNIRQVTFDGTRSGEGYFSWDMKLVSFQSVRGDCPHYQIFIKRLDGTLLRRITPGQGLTTCSFFDPDGKHMIWASTHLDPRSFAPPPKDRRARYVWDRHPSFDIFYSDLEGRHIKRLTKTPGYDAEGGISADGKRIVFTSARSGDLEIYTMSIDGTDVHRITHSKGYDGGPFFSPDGTQICFRGFRNPQHPRLAQIYLINADGTRERKLTNEVSVNWAPYWHPSGQFLVFCKNLKDKQGHPGHNFELMLLSLDGKRQVRLTTYPGADVLPVFSPDGKKLMWTSTRVHGSSQLFLADFTLPPGFLEGS